jgi:hypothetical protein
MNRLRTSEPSSDPRYRNRVPAGQAHSRAKLSCHGLPGRAHSEDLFGTLLTTRRRKPLARENILWTSELALVLLISLFALGCSGSSPNAPSQVNLMVTGTSGALSHTTPVTININQNKNSRGQGALRCTLVEA